MILDKEMLPAIVDNNSMSLVEKWIVAIYDDQWYPGMCTTISHTTTTSISGSYAGFFCLRFHDLGFSI